MADTSHEDMTAWKRHVIKKYLSTLSVRNTRDVTPVDRRQFLKLLGIGAAGAGAAALHFPRNSITGRATNPCNGNSGGSAGGSTSSGSSGSGSTNIDGHGPPESDGWTVAFEDTFTGNTLDESKWELGFGWGMNADYAKSATHEDAVEIQNNQLVLKFLQRNGNYYHGAINSKNIHEYGPGTYFECRMRAADLPGCNQAFWSKVSREPPAWPPEIDFVEIPTQNIHQSTHHLHPSADCGVNGADNDIHVGSYEAPSGNMTDNFHVFGCRWLEGSVSHFVDGNHIGTVEDSCAMQSFREGSPQFVILDNVIGQDDGWMGNTPSGDWSEYKTTTEVDWVRIWERT